MLAHQTLSHRASTARLALDAETHAWAQDLSRQWVAELERAGYVVEGDLTDLVGPGPATYVDPDHVPADELLPPALDAISALLVEGARLRGEEERLHAELAETRAELERARHTISHRVRRKAVRTLEESAPGRGVLGAYRRARRRG